MILLTNSSSGFAFVERALPSDKINTCVIDGLVGWSVVLPPLHYYQLLVTSNIHTWQLGCAQREILTSISAFNRRHVAAPSGPGSSSTKKTRPRKRVFDMAGVRGGVNGVPGAAPHGVPDCVFAMLALPTLDMSAGEGISRCSFARHMVLPRSQVEHTVNGKNWKNCCTLMSCDQRVHVALLVVVVVRGQREYA